MQDQTTVSRALASRLAVPQVAVPQRAWRLSIAGYLYLGGLGAGSFAVAIFFEWVGLGLAPAMVSPLPEWNWNWTPGLVLWGSPVAAVGASLLILHLGRNWYLFFTAGRNPRTSWLARGFSILLGFILLGLAVLLLQVLVPGWTESHAVITHAIEAMAVMAALGTAAYTGVLLQSMRYIPAWNVRLPSTRELPLLPLLFFVSAISTGSMGVVVGASVYHLATGDGSAGELIGAVDVLEIVLLPLEAVVLALYVGNMPSDKPEGALSAHMLMVGEWRYRFWIGVVGAALVAPFLLEVANLGLGLEEVALAAAASVLVGGLVLRLAILAIGIKETPPLYKASEWRRTHPLPSSAERCSEPGW